MSSSRNFVIFNPNIDVKLAACKIEKSSLDADLNHCDRIDKRVGFLDVGRVSYELVFGESYCVWV